MNRTFIILRRLTTLALLLAFGVVLLGAYTRLTDAGLGCPDWPGCYGKMVVSLHQTSHGTFELVKAWTEMIHRYAAGTLGLLIFAIIGLLCYHMSHIMGGYYDHVPRRFGFGKIAGGLGVVIVFQALLGMWTVTLKLLPVVVMGHLLGGMLLLSLLCFARWRISALSIQPTQCLMNPMQRKMRLWVDIGFLVVLCQIALGGWVSANYAGIACVGFPQCNGEWWPVLHWREAFNVFSPIGTNYQGGALDYAIRATIQWIHRCGALVTLIYIIVCASMILRRHSHGLVRLCAAVAIGLVLIQTLLGMINVVYILPLWSTVAHNGVAALLLLSMVSLHCLLTLTDST